MFSFFYFHKKYLNHPSVLTRVIYKISCAISYFLLAGIWIAIAFFFIIQYGRYSVVTTQLKSPFEVESKAAVISILNRGRLDFLEERVPIISNYVKKWENKLYADIEKKIPKDDLLLDMLSYEISMYVDQYYCKGCSSFYIKKLQGFLSKIKHKRSVVRGANLYWKPGYIKELTFSLLREKYTIYNSNQSNLEELQSYLRDMLYDDRDKSDPLYNYKQLLLVEAECGVLKKMLLNKYPNQSKKWCGAKEYKIWYKNVAEIFPEVIKLKEDPEVMGTYYAKDSIEYIEKQKEELNNFNKEYCSVK